MPLGLSNAVEADFMMRTGLSIRTGFIAGVTLTAGLSLAIVPGTAHATYEDSSPAPLVLSGEIAQTIAVDPATGMAYVGAVHGGSAASVYAIDLATDTVAAAIPVPAVPTTIAVDPVSDTVYVAAKQKLTITAIDGATNTVAGTISLSGVTTGPLAFDSATGLLYSGSYGSVAVINPATGSTTMITGLPGVVAALASDAQGKDVYAVSQAVGQGFASVIDTATDAVTKVFDVLPAPIAVAPDGTGTGLYVTSDGDDVARYDISSGLPTGSVDVVAFNAGSVLDPATGTLYVNQDGVGRYSLAQVNSAATAITGKIPVPGPGHIAVDQSTGTLVYTAVEEYQGVESTVVLQVPLAATGSITSGASVTFATGKAGTFTVSATGTPAPAFTQTGRLPAGVTLSAGGTLSGTPTAGTGGVYEIIISADNGLGSPVTQQFTLTVDQPAAITSANHATFTAGKAGRFAVTATGYPAPQPAESGKLPAGVAWSPGGTLSGTPKAGTGGVYTLEISATSIAGANASQRFTLTINQPATITSADHATFTHGKHGSVTIRTTGYPAASVRDSGALPAGLKFTASKNGTATISGAPAASARGKTYLIRLTATNRVGATASQRFTIKVS